MQKHMEEETLPKKKTGLLLNWRTQLLVEYLLTGQTPRNMFTRTTDGHQERLFLKRAHLMTLAPQQGANNQTGEFLPATAISPKIIVNDMLGTIPSQAGQQTCSLPHLLNQTISSRITTKPAQYLKIQVEPVAITLLNLEIRLIPSISFN